MQDAELITTTAQLEERVQQLLKTDAVAVDTEFFWERTFYPILGLVQLAGRDACWLVDAVRIPDLRALGPLLAAPQVTKVLHDAPQDLGILARASGAMPRSVFDTRLAAGFAGLDSTCSLQALLRDVLGIDLPKAETRSNWLRRPLSASQLAYAADDVRYLIALRDRLTARCADDTVRSWLAEELARLDDPSLYEDRDPRAMYQRVKGRARLNARQLAVLRELAAWRELEARKRDWPRAHVLPDDLLVTLALRAPVEVADFRAIPEMPPKIPETVAADAVAAVQRGLAVPDKECPAPAQYPALSQKRTLKPRTDQLLAHLASACAPYGIDPALAASRADAENYVRQQLEHGTVTDLPLVQGWRSRLLAGFTPSA